MKVYLKQVAYYLGLLPIIHSYKAKKREYQDAQRQAALASQKNEQFVKKHATFAIPPVELAYDAYGEVDWEKYDRKGLDDAQLISKLILKHAPSSLNILDWGCGPARVLRHLPQCLEPQKMELYGSDYNPKTIKWCRKHFKNFQFVINHLQPPLPFDANFFDVVYNISVFTHLSEQSHYEWINELYRVLKHEGILILTTHGDYFKPRLLPQELKHYEANHLVVRQNGDEGKRDFASFHPPKFLKEKLFSRFEVLEHIPGPIPGSSHLKQDVWVIKKM